MICLLFILSLCDTQQEEEDDEEYEPEVTRANFLEKNLENIGMKKDLPPRSQYAFVTIYSNDIAKQFGYLQMLVVLGYSLKVFNPTIDRVVVCHEAFENDAPVVKILRKAWTHVIFRKVIRWPDEFDRDKVINAKWFKFHAWTLTQYKKVLLMGADTMLFTDPSPLFHYQTPAASYYHSDYDLKSDGPLFNPDFMLIEPNLIDFNNLLEESLPYIFATTKDEYMYGKDDSAPINRVFRGRINLFPIFFNHENGGYKHTICGDPLSDSFKQLRCAFIHFTGAGKPWKKFSLYSVIWHCFAKIFNERLDLPFKSKGTDMFSEYVYKTFFLEASQQKKYYQIDDVDYDEENEIGDDYYPEIIHSGARRNFTMLFLILFLSLLFAKHIANIYNPFRVLIVRMLDDVRQFARLESNEENNHMIQAPEKKRKKRKRKK